MIRTTPKIITGYVLTAIFALRENFVKTCFAIIIAVRTTRQVFSRIIFTTIVAVAKKLIPTIFAISFTVVPHSIILVENETAISAMYHVVFSAIRTQETFRIQKGTFPAIRAWDARAYFNWWRDFGGDSI
jgi:ABC-type iron transport system FetAB permease component